MTRRILFVHYGRNWIRGSEMCLLNLLGRLDRTVWDPIVACTGEDLRREVELLGIPVHPVDIPEITLDGIRSKFQLLRYAKSFAALRALLRRHPVELIYANSGLPSQLGYPLSRLFGIPLVCHIHAQHPGRYPWMWLFKFADKVLCVSRDVEASLTRKVAFSGEVKVVYNGIDHRRFVPRLSGSPVLRFELGLDERHVVVGQVGSLIRRKGGDLLIRAVGALAERHAELRLLFVGDGEERERLRALAYELGLQRHVIFVGEIKDPEPYYSQVFDINVLASRAEGLGLSLLEGASCALPNIASRCGGIPEAVEDGVTGLLFEPERVDDLVAKLERLVTDPQLRREMG
ncbi:MAG: glycosyltransferase family 4 protein, partial [Nitrospiria bacterium]